MDVKEFPYSPFLPESVKFHLEGEESKFDVLSYPEGSLGFFHFSFGSAENLQEDKEYDVASLEYFPAKFHNKSSPLLQMAKNTKFASNLGEKLESVCSIGSDLELEVVVGLGKRSELLSTDMSSVSSVVSSLVSSNKLENVVLLLNRFDVEFVELFLVHFLAHLCPENRFKKDSKDELNLQNVFIFHQSVQSSEFSSFEQRVKVLAESVNMARELTNAPPNYANTVTVSDFLVKKLGDLGLSVKVLGLEECKKLNMFCYLSVGQGSKYPPKFLHAVYKPEGNVAKTLAFVGKGIMFDAGGYNVKNSNTMIHYMKMDMGGFGSVFSAANAVAMLKPKDVCVHFVAALCENMLDANSYRPGDVLTSSSGKTVEVLNTDAEGRVTLADSLYYAAKLEPDYLVDYATLTSACMIALGTKCAGFYSNDEELATLFSNSGKKAGELLWRLPLLKENKEFTKSKIADLANCSFTGKGGSISAALFLSEFVKNVLFTISPLV